MKFLNLFEITAEVSVLIFLIGIVRKLFKKKLNPNTIYFLWIFVALRILIPFRMEFSIVLPEALEPVSLHTAAENTGSKNYTADAAQPEEFPSEEQPELDIRTNGDMHVEPDVPAAISMHTKTDIYSEITMRTIPKQSSSGITWELILLVLWLSGAVIVASFVLVNNIYLSLTLRKHRQKIRILPAGIPLYAVPGYNCLAGIVFPAIYVDMKHPDGSTVTEDVIRHELQHYKVRDNFWQFLRTVCLILQWHNPFMWLAYSISKKDCELACDARVVGNMSPEERYGYGNSLLSVIESTLTEEQKIPLITSMGESRKFMSERINAIMKFRHRKSVVLSAVILGIAGSICFVSFQIHTGSGNGTDPQDNQIVGEGKDKGPFIPDKPSEEANFSVALNIQDYYITNTGDPSNLYIIDENNVLWGCGRNDYGQLGQGTQDFDFHEEMVKIAENVIHVDFSRTGFTIYLTEDHNLYGMGNAGCGALQQYTEFDWSYYIGGTQYTMTTPCLLMEDVAYARCGRSDVACLAEDSSVWIWGTIGFDITATCFEPKPIKVLENAVLVTGGMFNHAALLQDGSVWTWGYNYSGNCGIARGKIAPRPIKVAEDVIMVWTGSTEYNSDCHDISEFGGFYERQLENTIILKRNGDYLICGANVGTEEKVLPIYYEVVDYPMICTHEFLPYDGTP